MTVERPAGSRLKTYGDRAYRHTVLVRHQGTTVALALDGSRRIHYSVLDLDAAPAVPGGEGEGREAVNTALDVHHWSEDPKELVFPRELARAGYAALGSTRLPRVRQGGRTEAAADALLRDEDVDPYLSSTARLTADAPFQAVSDGRHVFVFRQAVGAAHQDALFRLTGGGASGDRAHPDGQRDADDRPRPLAADALLCDRFVLAGGELKPVLEVRYRRSRHRDRPESAKDSLGTTDMDEKPFHEPTLVLDFAGRVTEGRFTALLLPTVVTDTRRWQFFVHNAAAERIDAVNVEQADDGLFNTQGTRFYTSPDPAYRDSVLERSAGTCPFTGKPLVPVEPDTRFAESALALAGDGYAEVASGAGALKLGTGPYTVEAWLRPTQQAGTVLATDGGLSLALAADGALVLSHGPGASVTSTAVPATGHPHTAPTGSYTHVAAVYDGTRADLYVNGKPAGGGALAAAPDAGTRLLLGADGAGQEPFTGELDEIRIWDRARRAQRVADTSGERLVGDEPGLAAYYRFDEGTGTTAYDQGAHALHATLHGTTVWTASAAPVADHPGIRNDAFRVPGRTVVGGLSAALLHQQEESPAGHDGAPRPLKRQARVLLTWTASGEDGGRIAALDVAVARDGRLAQLPDVVELPVVGAAVREADPAEVERLGDEVERLNAEIPRAEQELARVKKYLEEVRSEEGLDGEDDEVLLWQSHYSELEPLEEAHLRAWPAPKSEPTVEYHLIAVLDQGEYENEPTVRHVAAVADEGKGHRVVLAEGVPDPVDQATRWTLVPWTDPWTDMNNRVTYAHAHHAKSGLRLAHDDERAILVKDLSGGGSTLFLAAHARFNAPSVHFDSGEPEGPSPSRPSDYLSDRLSLYCVPVQPSDDKGRELVKKAREAAERRMAFDRARATPNYVETRTQQITDLKNEVKADQEELGRLTDGAQGRSDKTLPMVHLGTDRLGLGWSGALLDFARAKSAPVINASGTGQLGVYYRDDQDRLTGLFYDTLVGRSGKRLAATDDTTVHLTARDAALDLAKFEVTVTADTVGPFADRCTLTLTARETGETETWSLLPRRAAALADAFNGLRAAPAPVATAASAKDGVLTLSGGGTRRALAAGDLLAVEGAEGAVYALADEAAKGATELRLVSPTGRPLTAKADAAVHLVPYDPSLVAHSRPGSTAAHGSRFVSAALIGVTGSVTDGTATDQGAARPSRWWGDLPGRALEFAAGHQPPGLSGRLFASARHRDDLTLEAWVRPAPGQDAARVVHAHLDGESQYALALGQAGGGGRPLVAGVGNRFVTSLAAVPDGRWTHVAAAFEQSWALRFGSGAFAEVPHADALDIGRDLTVEVFCQTDGLGTVQGLLGKGRTGDQGGKRVPYQLLLEEDGRLRFTFENQAGRETSVTSTGKVGAGTFHRVAVVRKLGDAREEKHADREIVIGGKKQTISVIESLSMSQWSDFTFYIDGAEAGRVRVEEAPELGHPGPLDIGRVNSAAPAHFTGVISEVRLWSAARPAADIGADLPPQAPGGGTDALAALNGGAGGARQNLVAQWRFEENEGNTARDESGRHPARLNGPAWVKNPDPKGSTFRLYLDGVPTRATPLAAADAPARGDWGKTQFTLGGRIEAGDLATVTEPYRGVIEEVRVWRTARTEEQLLDNLFGRLTGDTADLIAYYPFDDDSTEPDATELLDHGPRGLDLTLGDEAAARPRPVPSTAPISSDTPEVRSAFATGRPRYVQQVSAAPAVGEYADLQRMADGTTRGVLKRVYAYVQDGAWRLVTGFKLGDLVSEWVGQVQFDPQLIGYVEGAPPVPAENLVTTRRLSALTYINTTSVEFQQADQVIQALSSDTERSVDVAIDAKMSTEIQAGTLMLSAPFGFGAATPIVDITVSGSLGGSLEFSNAWGDQTEVSEGANTTRSTLVGLSGGWETDDPAKQVHAEGGRRFLPSNTGYALVQSETADVYALRVAHSGTVVAYRMLPNPDIPRDWNLVPFPINPRYTKQGTLDGATGYTDRGKLLDKDYPNAAEGGEYSYFKPREAYALRRRIVEDQQRRQAYYAGVSTDTHRADPTAERARDLASTFMGPVPGPGDKPGGRKEPDALSRRDIVNTYAWSADGGFFAETTETTDVVTETTTGSYRFNGMLSRGTSVGFTVFGAGFGLQLDAAIGGSLTRTRTRSKEATRTFSLDVRVDTPGDMQKYDEEANPVYDKAGKPVEVSGRVDAYRFMTFYLDSAKANFDDFYGKVVDQEWLRGADARAAALRQARQGEHTPPCWRVMHRVTFVSRKVPDVLPDGAPALEQAMRSADVSSNYELVRRLEPYVDPAARDRDQVARQVRDAIALHLPELTEHTERVAELMAGYYGIA